MKDGKWTEQGRRAIVAELPGDHSATDYTLDDEAFLKAVSFQVDKKTFDELLEAQAHLHTTPLSYILYIYLLQPQL